MKRCPKCSRTFPDENQKFCTFDGGLLRADQAPFDPNLTVRATAKDIVEQPPSTVHDPSEAKTSVRLNSFNETVASFGSSTFREASGSQTSSDLIPSAAESAPTSADLSAHAPVTVVSSLTSGVLIFSALTATTYRPVSVVGKIRSAGVFDSCDATFANWSVLR